MSAIVATYYYNGAGPSGAQATNLRFNLADDNDQDAGNPCVKPAAGTNLSFWKVIALYASVAPDTAINNVFIYTDGALAWAGCTLYVGDETPGAYSQATGSGDSGDAMIANYGGGGVITGQTDLFSYNSGSPKSVSGSIHYITGKITDYVALQVELTTGATAGVKPTEVVTWQYDET